MLGKERVGGGLLRWGVVSLLLLQSALFVACNEGIEYTADRSFPEAEWHKDTLLVFDYVNHDTLARHDLYFYIRHNQDYPHANFYLFLAVETPRQGWMFDTLNYMLASPTGEWYGRGFGRTKQLLLPYHKGFTFGEMGRYRFHLRHGMRYERLLGIEDFGVQIYQDATSTDGKK